MAASQGIGSFGREARDRVLPEYAGWRGGDGGDCARGVAES